MHFTIAKTVGNKDSFLGLIGKTPRTVVLCNQREVGLRAVLVRGQSIESDSAQSAESTSRSVSLRGVTYFAKWGKKGFELNKGKIQTILSVSFKWI